MAIIFDECGYAIPEFMVTTRCAKCDRLFREDESEWGSLCQDCGEQEDEEDRVPQ
jgi:Zn finger protein HypA/HybF involved in hydrogenase expression